MVEQPIGRVIISAMPNMAARSDSMNLPTAKTFKSANET